MNNSLQSEAPHGKPRGICGEAKRNCAEANPASPVGLRRDRLAIHPCGKPQGILAKANKTTEKPSKFVFETVADIDHLEEINNFIEKSLKALDIQGECYGHICVSLDEAVTNVVMYAYPQTKGNVRITLERINDRVLVEIIDSGAPFNPLNHPVPDVSASIEKRLIGGLGIHLMRNMMDELNYRRIDDKNCLFLVKHIGGQK